MKKKWIQFFVGVMLFFGFTQIQWSEIVFGKNNINEEIDNSALFYTESEEAKEATFFLKKIDFSKQ